MLILEGLQAPTHAGNASDEYDARQYSKVPTNTQKHILVCLLPERNYPHQGDTGSSTIHRTMIMFRNLPTLQKTRFEGPADHAAVLNEKDEGKKTVKGNGSYIISKAQVSPTKWSQKEK